MVGGEDQDFVDPSGGGLGEDRAPVGDHEGLVAFERRIEVGHDPDPPAPFGAVGFQCGRGGLLVPGAERGKGRLVSAWVGTMRGAYARGRCAL